MSLYIIFMTFCLHFCRKTLFTTVSSVLKTSFALFEFSLHKTRFLSNKATCPLFLQQILLHFICESKRNLRHVKNISKKLFVENPLLGTNLLGKSSIFAYEINLFRAWPLKELCFSVNLSGCKTPWLAWNLKEVTYYKLFSHTCSDEGDVGIFVHNSLLVSGGTKSLMDLSWSLLLRAVLEQTLFQYMKRSFIINPTVTLILFIMTSNHFFPPS